MAMREIVLPETKPETEWVRGRALQKMSPTWAHARIQATFVRMLHACCGERGEVLPEWRFRIGVPGEVRRPLVPDVAFVRHERLRDASDDELASPPFAPDVAIEILSPSDRAIDVRSKIDVYVRGGASLVAIVDPAARTIRAVDANDDRTFRANDTFEHDALPGFAVVVDAFFEAALRRPR